MGEVIIWVHRYFQRELQRGGSGAWPLLSLLLSVPVLVALYRRDGWLPLTTVFAVYASILYAAGLVCFTRTRCPRATRARASPTAFRLSWIRSTLRPRHRRRRRSRGIPAAVQHRAVRAARLHCANSSEAEAAAYVGAVLRRDLPYRNSAVHGARPGAYPFAYRTFDVDDLICNTLGSLIGWGLGPFGREADSARGRGAAAGYPQPRLRPTVSVALVDRLFAMIIDPLVRGGAASDGGGWFEADDGRRLRRSSSWPWLMARCG